MNSSRKHNPTLRSNNDTGFGTSATTVGGRFINKDGSFNLRREGISPLRRISIYQKMLAMPLWQFAGVILAFYFIINILFTLAYFVIGTSQFQGMLATHGWQRIKEVFYFSTQTFTTVGYGRINPVGDAANIISSLEALCGLATFAIVTGLIYGRFTKPQSYLQFSNYALFSPYNEKTALMFRLSTYKDNHTLTNVEVKVTLAMQADSKYNFYDLVLEKEKIDNLAMNWTVVHPIDENSPLYGFTEADIEAADVELYVLITAFNEVYSSSVLQRTSYTYREMKFKARFVPMYRESEDGSTTILEMNKLNHIKELS